MKNLEVIAIDFDENKTMFIWESAINVNYVISSLDDAIKILGEGVSLEIIRVKKRDCYGRVRVYISKLGTCCLLAQKYTS